MITGAAAVTSSEIGAIPGATSDGWKHGMT
jgi:hypothetical protein